MADLSVDDVTYEIYPLTGRQSLMWPYRIAKYIRGFFPAAGEKFDLKVALEEFFSACPEDKFIEFAEGMLETVHRNGKALKATYTVDFKGNPAGLYRLLIAICRYHFEGFFSELESLRSSGGAETNQETGKVKIRD